VVVSIAINVTSFPESTLTIPGCSSDAASAGKAEALFKGRQFDQEVIVLCVRWYLRYKLSTRDLVEMMAERGAVLVHTKTHHMRTATPLPYLTFTDHRIRVYR
jgi:hypothetical protein